jgi:hypothetical protein
MHPAGAALARKALVGSSSSTGRDLGGLESLITAAAKSQKGKAAGQAAAGQEFSIDLSKLSLEQLERLREKAREKQWEDEWWNSYMKYESDKKAAQEKEHQEKEKKTISKYNITLTR